MKTALITGGSQGFGKSIAKKLARLDYQVILLARREKFLKQAVAEIGKQANYFVCDIRDKNQVEKVILAIKKQYAQLDLLVNNAGVWTDDSLQEIDSEKMKQAIETNILGHIYITQAALPLLKQKKVTRIFNVISTSGTPAGNNKLWKTYGASKWGLVGYTNALKESLGKTNIQVLQFFPGGFDSNLYENAGRENPHQQPWMMRVEDVAEIAIFAITRPDDIYMEKIVVSKFAG